MPDSELNRTDPAPATPAEAPVHRRRPRYAGRNPRKFHEKYKELQPERYGGEVEKILQSGKTPAGMHRSIMVAEILEILAPRAGEIAIDATLGYGGHARALLEKLQPGGRLIGIDADPIELPRTVERLRTAGFGPEQFVAHRSNFAGMLQILARENTAGVDMVVADLGVSSMQLDNPERGFTYRDSGPLDMRMNPARGEPASQWIANTTVETLALALTENADEPHASRIAHALKQQPLRDTQEAVRVIRQALSAGDRRLSHDDVAASIRRTFQALRIAVNDEFSALDAFLKTLPHALKSGGRAAILTFHSGEDRRVKKAFQAGYRAGVYSAIPDIIKRAGPEEVRANPRAASAKLRWALRA
jgi:16S rRNA (cytosine1402-N4)-methyltransferase